MATAPEPSMTSKREAPKQTATATPGAPAPAPEQMRPNGAAAAPIETEQPVDGESAPTGRPFEVDAAPAQLAAKGARGKTLQRAAADAVAAGAFAQAARLYEVLARKHPDKPAYAEAASILRAKAGNAP